MSIENNILDAIDIIVDRAIAKAGFDKTVTAFIVECINETQGKYKVRYQDSVYEATSENTATKYLKNAEVYLLIPEGDFSKRKKILGTVEALGSNYIEEQEQYEAYENIGINVIHTKEEIGLCSYDPDTELVLYQYGDNENNKLAIDNNSLNQLAYVFLRHMSQHHFLIKMHYIHFENNFSCCIIMNEKSYNYFAIINLNF